MSQNSFTNIRVAVTAMGCISPLGASRSETAESLRNARDCVTPVTAFDVSGCQCKTAGQVPPAKIEEARGIDRRARRWSAAAKLMLLALAEAQEQNPSFDPQVAIIGTTSGGMPFGEAFLRAFAQTQSRRHAAGWVREYTPQQPVLDALWHFGWDAPCRVISNACASGTNALGHGFLLVRSGQAERVLCGGYDALCNLVFAGFDCLRAATADKCRPFDAARSGLVLGEGAAVFFLEPLETALRRGRPVLAEITGYGCSTDNYHFTQPNPDGSGPRRSMAAAIAMAGHQPGEIDYINAHGTATPYNDASEAKAIAALCPRAAVSSSKSQMGHALGAAGAIEAALCIHALQEGLIPANINFRESDPSFSLDIVANAARLEPLRCVLSNSLGFGGANASVILEAAGR